LLLGRLETAPAAILTIATPPPTGANNNLIYLKDSSSHIRYLIDTGAALSLNKALVTRLIDFLKPRVENLMQLSL
jgi:hypothetical protein